MESKNSFSLININLAGTSDVAKVLIEKISDAVIGTVKPWQIKRIAQAETDAEAIRLRAQLQDDHEASGAIRRLVCEEIQKQENIESIVKFALSHLSDKANPAILDNDWLVKFFGYCRFSSSEEMRMLWAHILASETNCPGSFSERAIKIVHDLSKSEAELFSKFCSYHWIIGGAKYPLILDITNPIFYQNGITFHSLSILEVAGLVTIQPTAFNFPSGVNKPDFIPLTYHQHKLNLEFPQGRSYWKLGEVTLTEAGKELAVIPDALPNEEYYSWTISELRQDGYILTEVI